MLTRLEKAQQKWGGSHTVIDKWLSERQELLVLYCRIAGFSPYDKKDHALPDQLQIQNFCQLLMDYLSAGHFEVYDDIANLIVGLSKEAQRDLEGLFIELSRY